MPVRRPQPPRGARSANTPRVGDSEVSRALAPLVDDVRDLQGRGQPVLADGSRPPALGNDAAGDLWYRGTDGRLARLPAGTDGQVLTMVDGLPRWA